MTQQQKKSRATSKKTDDSNKGGENKAHVENQTPIDDEVQNQDGIVGTDDDEEEFDDSHVMNELDRLSEENEALRTQLGEAITLLSSVSETVNTLKEDLDELSKVGGRKYSVDVDSTFQTCLETTVGAVIKENNMSQVRRNPAAMTDMIDTAVDVAAALNEALCKKFAAS